MELGPIFRALMHHKTRFWLIALEVALTFAIVANCVNLTLDLRRDYLRPSGYDEANLLVVRAEPFTAEFQQEDFLHAIRDRDLEAFHALPGVANAAAVHAVPMSGGGSGTGRKALGSELETVHTPYFRVAGPALDTFGVELVAGRALTAADWDYQVDEEGTILHRNAILTQELAEEIFPQGDPVGRTIQNHEGSVTNTIVGVVRYMHNSWPQGWERANRTMIVPGDAVSERRMLYLVRTEPGAVDAVFSELEGLVRSIHPGRTASVETLLDVKRRHYSASTGMIRILTSVVALLLFVTTLGIVGLTSFAVADRKRQIGTRRALGARRRDIVRYFLLENWIITGIGLLLGLGLSLALNYALVQLVDSPKLDWQLIVAGMGLLWLSGILAALAPALQASAVPPVVATKSV